MPDLPVPERGEGKLPKLTPRRYQGEIMSEPEKAENSVPSTETATSPAQPAEPPKSDRVTLMREKAAAKRSGPPRPAPVPSLEYQAGYNATKKIDKFDDAMERELQEAMGGLDAVDLLGDPATHDKALVATGGMKMAKVFRVHGQDVFLDLPGGRSQGILPTEQFPEGTPEIGTEVEVNIEGFDNANGLLILSRKGAALAANWDSVTIGMTVEARVTATNKGGLSVDVNGIRGFLPISQVDLYRTEEPEKLVNTKLLCMVTEVDRADQNLVVSRRALMEKEREQNREKLWAELTEGQVYEGIVRSVRDFGAFVDLGGVDGLVHVSEISWTRVKDATQILQPGQKVRVVVLKIDRETRKVGLGLKQLTDSPWANITEKYPPGSVVNGTVSKTMDFGAFVELEPAIEGLIHISELSPQRVRSVTDIVKVGQSVQVMVLTVDPEQRRISLSLKAALPKEAAPEPVASEAEAEEPEAPAKPYRPRTTPLRGGTSNKEWMKKE